ncbi:MAG: hypothetical protein VYD57_08395 [Pseudomonadota bacterium]|nr:hypothetical protein [Pseudomonadota bacterium]
MRPRSLVAVAERSMEEGDWNDHIREFLDAFYGADGDIERQSAMIADEPRYLGHPQADAFIGGVGEHLARRWALDMPGWVRDDRRYLDMPMFVPNDPSLKPYLIVVSPPAFRTRLIFTGPDPLQRARFPYHRGVVAFPAESAGYRQLRSSQLREPG